MTEQGTNMVQFIEDTLDIRIEEGIREILLNCKETVNFIRNMSPTIDEDARLVSNRGQIVIALDVDDTVQYTHIEPSVGKQHRYVLRGVKKPTTKKVIVVTNLDHTKQMGSGIWVWEF